MAPGNPKSMALILLFSIALLFSVTTAARKKTHSIKECVKLVFDPPPVAPTFWKRTLCRDLLRTNVKSFQITGDLSQEYLTALKKLPRFNNNPAGLNNFLCGLGPAKEAAMKLGC
ncbi:hypothetical protein PHJA_001063700 [Phtheirospermum japonicum]|uniref:Uncharacterized protein n=1 Tax=Phtheirospermum japonicum TaxID=374723 RepID=A0A830BNR7_9LAMI|nr:hypothetical protein PHJA_001063700 [Phtheirospermum japonicum]